MVKREKGAIEKLFDGIDEIADDEDDMTELLYLWKENNEGIRRANKVDEKIKKKVNEYLKDRKWDRYVDKKSKISVTISVHREQTIDKEQLNMLLDESQIATVLKTRTVEKLTIITPDMRRKLARMV